MYQENTFQCLFFQQLRCILRVKDFSICFSSSLAITSEQHEGAHLEQPLGHSLWADDKSFLHVHWNLGYSSRTLRIPASKPGQDCTNTSAILRKQAGRRWVICLVQDSDSRLIVMC